MKIPSIKSFLFKRKHKVISSHSPVPSFFARGLKRMSYLETLSPIFLRFLIVFSDLPFPLLKLISIIIELGDVCGDKIGSPCAEHSRGCMEEFCLSPTLRRKQGKVSSILFYLEKCLCVLKSFCTYLLLIFLFLLTPTIEVCLIKSRLKVLMKNFLCFQTIISPIDVFILCR